MKILIVLAILLNSTAVAEDGNVGMTTQATRGTSNSNICLSNLGMINDACNPSSVLPSSECCLAVSNLNKDGCFCNPVLSLLMGQQNFGKVKNQLLRTCRLLTAFNPLRWWPALTNRAKFNLVDCTPFAKKSYAGGMCGVSDVQIDAQRLESSLGFSSTILQYAKVSSNESSKGCFSLPQFVEDIAQFFIDTPNVTVSFGIGQYIGLVPSIEYLAILIPAVNRNLWIGNIENAESDPLATLQFLVNGDITLGGATCSSGKFLDQCYKPSSGYIEQTYSFGGQCETKIAQMDVPAKSILDPTRGTRIADLSQTFYYAAQYTKTWGYEAICNYHEQYCANGPWKQYNNYTECLQFITALPKVSPVCGGAGILGGNSSTCRFKHHFMIPFEPDVHCPHIGRGDMADSKGQFKCNDVLECQPTNPALGVEEYMKNLLPPPAAALSCANLDQAKTGPFVFPNIC